MGYDVSATQTFHNPSDLESQNQIQYDPTLELLNQGER